MVIFDEKVLDMFWTKVNKGPECWEWKAGISRPNGYGKVKIRYKDYRVHRLSYEIEYGPIPKDMLVCHHCDNKLCVRPSHLFLGTQKDNLKDCIDKGRISRGEQRPLAKLTKENIKEIRIDVRLNKDIALAYSVHPSTIEKIKNRKTWRHVK